MAELARPASGITQRAQWPLRPYALPIAFGLLIVAVLIGVGFGPVAIGPGDTVNVIVAHITGLSGDVDPTTDAIIWDIRLPRVLLAGVVGGTLAFSGAAYQGLFRNPLADPYLLGVASGAGLAETIFIVAGLPLAFGGFSALTLVGFGGGMASVMLAYSLARVGGRVPSTTLVLAGVAITSMNVAAISYLMLVSQENTLTILAWLLGGFNNAGWRHMTFVLPYIIPAAIVVFAHGRLLNVLQLDEQEARQVGVEVERTKLLLLVAASLAAAAAVSVAGVIGFVGLIAPHAVRLVIGPDYRRLLPVCALVGASFLIVADVGAKTLVSPGELPVGVLTAFVGGPFFLLLLRRQRRAMF